MLPCSCAPPRAFQECRDVVPNLLETRAVACGPEAKIFVSPTCPRVADAEVHRPPSPAKSISELPFSGPRGVVLRPQVLRDRAWGGSAPRGFCPTPREEPMADIGGGE
eukprot:4379922-Pyramimonas_sp.AAC.1